MKTEINAPGFSKINYTALLIQLVGLAAVFDLIPAAAEQPIIEITMIVGPAIIQVFRTWCTKPKGV